MFKTIKNNKLATFIIVSIILVFIFIQPIAELIVGGLPKKDTCKEAWVVPCKLESRK